MDDDSEPPAEELEMAIEELQGGKPLAGAGPAERIEALTKRIAYLEQERIDLLKINADEPTLSRNAREHAAAVQQLKDWQTLHQGRN
jgi:hypothetical protein